MEDRSTKITVRDKEYELILSVAAVKKIVSRFGGLEKIGDAIHNASYEEKIDIFVWLICLMGNQGIALYNFENPDDKMDLWTEEYLEMVLTPADILENQPAIMEAMTQGAKRNIKSQPTPSKKKKAKTAE